MTIGADAVVPILSIKASVFCGIGALGPSVAGGLERIFATRHERARGNREGQRNEPLFPRSQSQSSPTRPEIRITDHGQNVHETH